jgi:hypothetical protein
VKQGLVHCFRVRKRAVTVFDDIGVSQMQIRPDIDHGFLPCIVSLKAFHEWLGEKQGTVPESTKLGDAIGYALRERPMLERYVEDWQLTPDNNACERGIRPFVMGRKNWVMSGSPAGAKSSCELYTLIETAKANGWNPFKYLAQIFEEAAAMNSVDDWIQLLPWNLAHNFSGVAVIDVYAKSKTAGCR